MLMMVVVLSSLYLEEAFACSNSESNILKNEFLGGYSAIFVTNLRLTTNCNNPQSHDKFHSKSLTSYSSYETIIGLGFQHVLYYYFGALKLVTQCARIKMLKAFFFSL